MVSENIIANQKTAFSASQFLLLKASALYFKRFLFTKKKRTLKRISLPFLYVFSITAASCRQHHKYNWIPTECAPENYPVRIYDGNFFYGENGQIYIPKGRLVNYGWGEDGSINIAGDKMKEAPHKLEITWLSYTEKTTYTGSFDLDTKKIDSLFKKGYGELNSAGENITYNALKVGMAPGGLIVVWISGEARQVEVGSYQAHPINVNWKKEFPDMEISMDKHISKQIAKLPEDVQNQIKDHKVPINTWKNWRKRYKWDTKINISCHPDTLYGEYFNAEQTINAANAEVQPEIAYLAVPRRMYVFWKDHKNNALRTDIDFDEHEIFNAFEHLKDGENGELSITINPDSGDAVIKLKTKEKEILLKKTNINTVLR